MSHAKNATQSMSVFLIHKSFSIQQLFGVCCRVSSNPLFSEECSFVYIQKCKRKSLQANIQKTHECKATFHCFLDKTEQDFYLDCSLSGSEEREHTFPPCPPVLPAMHKSPDYTFSSEILCSIYSSGQGMKAYAHFSLQWKHSKQNFVSCDPLLQYIKNFLLKIHTSGNLNRLWGLVSNDHVKRSKWLHEGSLHTYLRISPIEINGAYF